MAFTLIDLENWERREHYLHFLNEVRCSYSVSVNMDISNLKGKQLYPTMIWLLTQTVNLMREFRTTLTDGGLGYFDVMHPAYTIFNQEQKTFSGIWTAYQPDYQRFLKDYKSDVETYASSVKYTPKPDRPSNSFDVSMVPWFSFTAFNIHVFGNGKYFLPIFTMGKTFETDGKQMLPLAIQVHHAVCDGYHVGKFIEILQNKINKFDV